jgi:hypothetical protein
MYKGFLNHFKAIKAFTLRHNGHANVNVDSCILEIRIGSQVKKFLPQFFFTTPDGRAAYTPNFGGDSVAFVGWLPYYVKRWQLSSEKLKSKEYLIKNGIPVPAHSVDPDVDMPDVIIKKNQSSFGSGIKGPFRSSRECKIEPSTGEYYERFIRGKIVKIWYWNAMPVVMEILNMPSLTGDGKQTVRQIYANMEKGGLFTCPEIETYSSLLAFQGHTPDSVPALNESVVLDFKYLSPLFRATTHNKAVLCNEDHVLYPQLRAIGEVLWQGIPVTLRQNTAYSVDAMLDNDGVLYVLEMNSNPQLHPDIYATMLEGLFFNRPFRHQVNPPPPSLIAAQSAGNA